MIIGTLAAILLSGALPPSRAEPTESTLSLPTETIVPLPPRVYLSRTGLVDSGSIESRFPPYSLDWQAADLTAAWEA